MHEKSENTFVKENYNKKELISRLISSAFVNLFFAFTLLFFSPLEVFMGNANEFVFSLGQIWWILLLTAFAAAAILTVVALALPKTVSFLWNMLCFALGLCCYVQSMFLNGSMGSLTGDEDTYSDATVYINLGIWVFIILALLITPLILKKFGKLDIFKKGVFFVAAALTAMQLTAFTTGSLTMESPAQLFYLNNEGQFELSNQKNTVIFIVDTCDGSYVDDMLDKNPEFLEGFDGFINYPDAVSTHSRTYPSLPYLLTGEICHFDKPYKTFIDEAHANSSYLSDIDKTDCHIGIYTDNQYIGKSSEDLVDNTSDYGENVKISFNGVVFWMGRMSLYRNTPYIAKSVFTYTDQQLNNYCIVMPNACYASKDIELYRDLVSKKLTTTDSYNKALRLYHLWGPHAGADFDRDMNYSKNVDTYEALLGDFTLIREYLDQMKEQGIYDDATIIITADHGISGGTSDEKPLEIDSPVRSLMMVKPAGTSAQVGMTTSEAPVCHADLFATVIDSFGGNTEDYGKTIFEYDEGEERTRLYYHTMMYSDIDGEVVLREYAITGDSRDFENWKLTGNYWDILYSERAVSRHRLSEVLD